MMKLSGWTIASTLAVIFYSWLVVAYADNLPKYDDLHDAFGFFIEYHKADSWHEKLQSFFHPNNEHVTLVNHLIYWLQVTINGELDFRQLVWLGNLVIIATALLASRLHQTNQPYLSFIVIVGFLSLSFWDSSFKAMTSLSNQAVIFFALLSLIWAEKNRWGLAVIAALLCHYSQSNGIFIWPLLLLMCKLSSNHQPKPFWLVGIAAFFSTMLYIIIIIHYKAITDLSLPEVNQGSIAVVYQTLLMQPLLALHACINFIGSAWLSPEHPWLITSIGIVLFALFLMRFNRYEKVLKHQVIFLFLIFLLISMIIIAFTRATAYQDAHAINTSRYKMYPLLFSLLVISMYLMQLKQRLIPIMAATTVSALTLFAIPSALIHVQQQTLTIRNSLSYWIVDGDFRRLEALHIHNADLLYFHAEYLGVWNPYKSADLSPLRLEKTDRACLAIEQLPYCSFQIQHRLNGLAAQLINPNQLEIGSRLQLCSSDHPSYISEPLTETHRQQTRLLIDRARISHEYQYAILHKKNTALCQTPLQFSLRDREQEIKENLGH